MADSREVMNIDKLPSSLEWCGPLYKYVNEQKIPAFKLGTAGASESEDQWDGKRSRWKRKRRDKKRKSKAAAKAAGTL